MRGFESLQPVVDQQGYLLPGIDARGPWVSGHISVIRIKQHKDSLVREPFFVSSLIQKSGVGFRFCVQ